MRAGTATFPPPVTVSRPTLLVDGSDGAFRSLVHGMLAFSARLEAVRSGFASLIGLSGIQYTILISVRHLESNGDVGVRDVARHLRLSGAFVTIETGKLLKLGLLTKYPDARDRRRVRMNVTAQGAALLGKLAPLQSKVNDELFACLDARRFRELRNLVNELVECGDRAVHLLDYLSADRTSRAIAARRAR